MTREEAIEKLRECQQNDDIEAAHIDADAVLIALLDDLGYWDVTEEWSKITKWYA